MRAAGSASLAAACSRPSCSDNASLPKVADSVVNPLPHDTLTRLIVPALRHNLTLVPKSANVFLTLCKHNKIFEVSTGRLGWAGSQGERLLRCVDRGGASVKGVSAGACT